MTYRQLLLAIKKAKDLETERFWARDRELQSKRSPLSDNRAIGKSAYLAARRAEIAFDREIDFDDLT